MSDNNLTYKTIGKNMRSPSWHRDEIILALDLYRTLDLEEMNKKNSKVIELSDILNILTIHSNKNENVKFRNPTGIEMKLANFKAIDPDFIGKGMTKYSKKDEEIFFEFKDRNEELHLLANRIKQIVSNKEINEQISAIQDEESDTDYSAPEGKVISKLHKLRERDSKINKIKKEQYFKKFNKLDCEVCGFDFKEVYGDLGEGFIEAHHRVPLSELSEENITTLDDLALVCSNCHRMLHKKGNSIIELSNYIKNITN